MRETKSEAARIFGARVRENRQRLGISQETLAQLSDVHWTFVGQVERGTRNLSLHNIIKIAGGLDVDPAVLVAGIAASAVPVEPREQSAADRIRSERQAGAGPVAK
ncbi:MAG: family transcriptional regulator [Glaciihabitans sp.]|jgi:transcriptional regulator with XRE-family HTH domain|nr:family transcriptional regulator [Glaciihabitans sp.]